MTNYGLAVMVGCMLAAASAHAVSPPSAVPMLSAVLASGAKLQLSHFDSPQGLAQVYEGLSLQWPDDPLIVNGQLLWAQQEGDCHTLLSLHSTPSGTTGGSHSRLCAAASDTDPMLGSAALLLHAHAEDQLALSVWSIQHAPELARQWLEAELASQGWQAGDSLAWVKGEQQLEAYLTPLDAISGLLLVRRHD
ncbi:hypothetical protein ACLQ81_14500 [Bordetella avium]|uniref:hypothetical protein n=1 Tax=Bordetella avium TaxID=521 RepID=UPI0039FBA02B